MMELAKLRPEEHELQAEAMEAQHELLTSLMRMLAERDAAGASKLELSGLLRELESCTASHFKEEEAYMRDVAYPKLDTHQLIHRDLLAMFRRHLDEFDSGRGRLGCKLLSFLKYWLASHIDGMDRNLAPVSHPLSKTPSGQRAKRPAGA
jgi:hemerythrin-like metal-binding protein